MSTTKERRGKDQGKTKKASLPPVEHKAGLTQTEDILNSILPPREWTEDGQLWVQYVSSTPATRLDVINLQERLDQQLQQRQARETGICPVREELYAQCFDELIRQASARTTRSLHPHPVRSPHAPPTGALTGQGRAHWPRPAPGFRRGVGNGEWGGFDCQACSVHMHNSIARFGMLSAPQAQHRRGGDGKNHTSRTLPQRPQ